MPILLYCNYEDTQPPPNNYFLAISSDNFSKSESPKDYYNEILLDYKGNLVPVYKRLKDPIFKKKDILIHNNCPVFKYQDRNHNNNFNKKTSNKIRLRSLKKTRLDYHYLDSMKTIKRLKQYIFN